MKKLLNNASEKAKGLIGDKSLPVQITADMLLMLFRKQLNEEVGGEIHNLDITFCEDFIRISGLTKKLLMQIYFEIHLKPLRSEGRTLVFEVLGMKPINQDWLKSKVLNKPPVTEYKDDVLHINLNGIEKVRSVPFGSIKGFEIKDEKLVVRLGL